MNKNKTIIKDSNPSNIQEDMDILAQDILEVRYINSDNSKFEETIGGFVSLEYKEKVYPRVNFYRTFPFTEPTKYISVREPNEKAREIAMIPDLTVLTAAQQSLVVNQLNIRYFTPVVSKIVKLKQEYGYAYFDTITNFGRCKFTTRITNSSVVSLSDIRLLLIDIDGNRFEIPDVTALSPSEQKKIELIL